LPVPCAPQRYNGVVGAPGSHTVRKWVSTIAFGPATNESKVGVLPDAIGRGICFTSPTAA